MLVHNRSVFKQKIDHCDGLITNETERAVAYRKSH